MATKKTAEKKKRKKKRNSFWRLLGELIVFIGRTIYNIFRILYKLSERIVSWLSKERGYRRKSSKGKLTDSNTLSKLDVLEVFKGSFDAFWNKLYSSDSLIGIIVGARGSGKTAVALSIIENLKGQKKKFFAMGFQSKDLPKWIEVIEDVQSIENDSFVVIDEGGILFSSRESMSSSNKLLSELLFIARHKNLTIFFISQNSSSLEINTLRQADFLVLKRSSLLQKDFERKIIAKIYEEYKEGFEKHKNKKGISLIYSDQFIGFVNNDLPSFWSSNVSKSFK